ncbi:hypothetical protein CM15mP43_10220 [bacterium]|nr:MAG: hypothetical protein CM15mP43_10220 [bacterium]
MNILLFLINVKIIFESKIFKKKILLGHSPDADDVSCFME